MFRKRTYANMTSAIVRFRLALIAAFCLLASLAAMVVVPLSSAMPAPATTPTSGTTLTDSSGPLTFTGGPYVVPNPSSQVDGIPICNAALTCDEYAFNVAVSSATSRSKYIRIEVAWTVVGEAQFDLYVFDGTTASGKIIAKSLGNQTYVAPDVALIPAVAPSNGIYTLRIVPFLPFGQSITGTVSLVDIPAATPLSSSAAPSFSNHISPGNLGNNAGEPSLGIDWSPRVASLRDDSNKINTGGVAFFQSGPNTLRVSFDDRTSPSTATWEDKSAATVQEFVLSDPIGFVDRKTGRVFSLDLIGGEGNSFAAYSDDDGNSWTPMQGGGAPAGPDHQTLGGGPYNDSAVPAPPPHPLYEHAVYYCSQNIVGGAECSRSDDGGLTFGPGVDIFTPTQCYGGIHGHVKVGPDGTVYVPNSSCTSGNGGSQGMAVSRDNGLTWTDSTVPTSTGSGDPSVGIDADNKVYLGYLNADGRPHIAVSSDHGTTWTKDWEVGVPVDCNAAADSNPAYAPCRIKSAVFPVVVAGDKDRAAFGFLGSTTGGNYQDEATYQGIWYFYVAATYDGGNTWTTVNATPGDPVQKGSICLGGLTCGNDRNLLDFNDMTIDREGRVLAAYADGCVAPACAAPNYTGRARKAAIVRQLSGKRMFAAFDPDPSPTPTPSACPHSGTLSPSNTNIAYCGGPFAVPNPSSPTGDNPPACAPGTCDQFALTISIPPGDQNQYAVNVSVGWTDSSSDFDLYVYQPDEITGSRVTKGEGSTNPEVARFFAAPGSTYTIYVVPYDVQPDATFSGTIGLTPLFAGPAPTPTPVPTPRIVPVANQDTGPKIGFENFTAPGVLTPVLTTSAGQQVNSVEYLGRGAGEPSIGNNWKTGVTTFQSDLQTLFVTFADTCPANGQSSTWVNRPATTSQAVNSDPIGFTDPQTGRTFAGELTLLSPTCKTSYTDDDGRTWVPTQGSGIASGVDHQTIGGGPFAAPLTRPTNVPGLYPNAVYYCSQEGVPNTGPPSFCSRSDDGGLTFGPSVPLTTPPVNQCGGLHGHVKVSPQDGAAYVPFNQCGGVGSVLVSLDSGTTWTIRHVESGGIQAKPSVSFQDPAVAIDSNGRVYYIIAYDDTAATVFTSDDHGATWQNRGDVGAAYGLQNIRYPAATAGDAGRAAVSFYGTTTPGDALQPTFDGFWHLYIANTFDGGQTWTTTDATPNAPLQRGCIWAKGGANICRNLLDFFDMTVDREGRVLVGYVNGCEGGNCAQAAPTAKGNAYTAAATIARQSSGRRLLAVFDPLNPKSAPGVPSLTSRRIGNVVHLGWSLADTGNSPITSYKIMRGTVSGAETLLTTVSGTQTAYDDTTATDTTKTYYYKVLAVNAIGTSCGANEVAAPYVGETCSGVIIHRNDPTHPEANAGTNTPASLLIDYVAVGEPPGSNNFMFKLKVNSLASIPSNSRWRVVWNSFSAEAFDSVSQQFYVGMTTGNSGAPTFEYGTMADAGLPAVFVISETKRGDALPGSNFNADGTITIIVPKSAFGNPQPGDLLGAVNGRTLTGDTPQTNKLERSNLFADHTFVKAQTDNSYPAATYMVAGNTDCLPFTEELVNSLVSLQTSNPSSSSGSSSFNLTIKNISTQTIFTPLRAEAAQLSSASGKVKPANADNSMNGIGAAWDYNNSVGTDNILSPNELSGPRNLRFSNPNSEPFTVTFNVIGNLAHSSSGAGSSSSTSPGGGGVSGSSGSSSSSNTTSTVTNLVFKITYNPLLNSITVQVIRPG